MPWLHITLIFHYASLGGHQTEKKVNPEQPKLPKVKIPINLRFRGLFLSPLQGIRFQVSIVEITTVPTRKIYEI